MGNKGKKTSIVVLLVACAAIVSVLLTSCGDKHSEAASTSSHHVIGGSGAPYECASGTEGSITFTRGSVTTFQWNNTVLKAVFDGKKVTIIHRSGADITLRGIIIGDDEGGRIGMDIGGDNGQPLRHGDEVSYDNSDLFAGPEGIRSADDINKLTGTEVVETTICT